MPEEAEVITPTPETEAAAVQPQSFEDAGMKFVEQEIAKATSAAEEGTQGEAATAETAEVVAPAETPAPEQKKEPEPEPFTPEQMADDAFFDKLDKAGWEKLEKLHPALFKMGKAVASARGKAFARLKGLPETPAEERPHVPEKPKVSDAMKAALKKANSLDEDEAFEGQQEVSRLTFQEERQREREQTQAASKEAQEVIESAYDLAKGELPALATISDDDLDAEVKASPKMLKRVSAAISHPDKEQRVLLLSSVMEDAARSVLAKRQAAAQTDEAKKAAEKKAADQARLRANEKDPSRALVESTSGKGPSGKKAIDTHGMDYINSQLAAATRTG